MWSISIMVPGAPETARCGGSRGKNTLNFGRPMWRVADRSRLPFTMYLFLCYKFFPRTQKANECKSRSLDIFCQASYRVLRFT